MSLKYGNQDKAQKYDISKLNTKGDKYVVRHFGYVELGNGEKMEDPSSNRFQVYDKKTFNDMTRQPEVNGKQGKSKFQQIGMNVHVLHNPEVVEELAGGVGNSNPGAGAPALKHHAEVIKLINEAISADEVDSLIAGDQRPSVVKAAETKKKELAGGV